MQKVKELNKATDEILLTKMISSHWRDRPARKVKELNDVANKNLIMKIILPKNPKKQKCRCICAKEEKLKEQKVAVKNSEALVPDFEFDLEEILDKSLLFDLKKTSQEKILERLIANLPEGNDQYYVKHREGTNSFQVRHDRHQKEKEDLFEFILNTDKKLRVACQPKKTNVANLKRLKKCAIKLLKELGENYEDE